MEEEEEEEPPSSSSPLLPLVLSPESPSSGTFPGGAAALPLLVPVPVPPAFITFILIIIIIIRNVWTGTISNQKPINSVNLMYVTFPPTL